MGGNFPSILSQTVVHKVFSELQTTLGPFYSSSVCSESEVVNPIIGSNVLEIELNDYEYDGVR